MESASSPKLRLPGRQRRDRSVPAPWKLAVWGLLAAWLTGLFNPGLAIQCWIVLGVFLLGLLWCYHLQMAALSAFWSNLLAALVTVELLLPLLHGQQIPSQFLLGTLCSCLLLYLLMKTLGGAISHPGLQEVASSALVLAIAFYSRPVVAVGSALLSVILWLRCLTRYGGALKSALLIYMPAAVGFLTIVVMHKLTPGVYAGALSTMHTLSDGRALAAETVAGSLREMFPALVFAACAVLTRIIEQCAGYGDLAYLAMLLFLVACLCLGTFPRFMNVLDMRMILYAGAMSLLAMAPPRRVWSLLFLTSTIVASLWPQLAPLHIFPAR